jgi:hypothetical protein
VFEPHLRLRGNLLASQVAAQLERSTWETAFRPFLRGRKSSIPGCVPGA